MDCSLPESSVHEIFQARILEWVATSFSRESSWPRDGTCVSCTGRWILYHSATWEAHKRNTFLKKILPGLIKSNLRLMNSAADFHLSLSHFLSPTLSPKGPSVDEKSIWHFGLPSSACNVGNLGSIPGSGRSPGERNGSPFQYSCLENLMDRGAWRATVHEVARVRHDLAAKHVYHIYIVPLVSPGLALSYTNPKASSL